MDILNLSVAVGVVCFFGGITSKLAINAFLNKDKSKDFEIRDLKAEVEFWKTETADERYLRKNWHTQSERWKAHFERENRENTQLRRVIAELQRSKQTQSTPSLAGEEKTIMVKALKKAMFEAHPDRGGNSEEFIKINQLYKKMK